MKAFVATSVSGGPNRTITEHKWITEEKLKPPLSTYSQEVKPKIKTPKIHRGPASRAFWVEGEIVPEPNLFMIFRNVFNAVWGSTDV